MKQTALQYFLIGLIDLEIGKGIPTDKQKELYNLYNKTKAMEREHIMQSLNDGKAMALGTMENKSLEQYYEQTYGGNNE